jgi:hypothetical protein
MDAGENERELQGAEVHVTWDATDVAVVSVLLCKRALERPKGLEIVEVGLAVPVRVPDIHTHQQLKTRLAPPPDRLGERKSGIHPALPYECEPGNSTRVQIMARREKNKRKMRSGQTLSCTLTYHSASDLEPAITVLLFFMRG